MRTRIINLTNKVIERYSKELNAQHLEYDIEVPKQETQGDISVNIAFKLSRIVRKAPLAIAQELLPCYEECVKEDKELDNVIDRIEVAKPGFINFFFTPAIATLILKEINAHPQEYGTNNYGKGEKVLIEFVSANPTGPLTIAHGRQACIGDTLAAIMKTCGYDVVKEYYLNDGGNQIRMLGLSVFVRYLEKAGRTEPFPEEGYQGVYITDIAEKIHSEKGDTYAQKDITDEKTLQFFSQHAADLILSDIKEDLKTISVVFDNYYPESSLYEKKIQAALAELDEKNFCYEKEGAVWLKTTEKGDDKDRVLVKSDKTYTYLVPDIAYHKDKFERGFTTLINLLGPDHHGYIKRLKASVDAIGYNQDKLHVMIVQLTTLYKDGAPFRMSTRKGTFVSLRELIKEVGADATRLFFLMKLTESHLDFDLKLAKEKSQDNPVYYFQYAFARISSILRLAEIKKFSEADLSLLVEPEEMKLVKLMADYSNILITASRQFEPYRLVDYLRELAASFHKFYNKCRVIGDDKALSKARLYLVSCVREVIGSGLSLLGVSQPERM
ncbi:arginine--tRNA ligase [Candidatus Omnitrophota bacterium]